MTATTDTSPAPSGELLKARLERIRTEINEEAGGAIDELSKIATGLDLKNTSDELIKVSATLRSDTFGIIVAGRFKNGKSTLLNSLLGRPTVPIAELGASMAPMPMDDMPCTATLTRISYSEKPYVRAWGFDGKFTEWSLAKYLRESIVKDNAKENNSFFADIQAFDIGFPAELCKSGVVLMDSPGLDDVPRRTKVTQQAVQSADAAVVVYKSDAFGGMSELQFVSDEIVKGKTRVFTVINMFKVPSNEERFKRFVWDRLITEQEGPAYAGQDFSTKDIYFVNALDALEGKLENNAEKVAASGLGLLEQRLGQFLVTEKHYAHIQKFMQSAYTLCGEIDANIARRKQGLQRETEELETAYTNIQPQLAAVRARRDKLPRIFERYAREAQFAVQASFEQMIAGVRQDLPPGLNVYKFKSLQSISDRMSSSFHQDRIVEEGMNYCNAFIAERVHEWGTNEADQPGVQQAMQPIIAHLLSEVEQEITAIEREYQEANFELTGWQVKTDNPKEIVPLRERVLSGVMGVVCGDVFTALGAGGGYKSVAASLGAFWGTLLIVGTGGVGLLVAAGAAVIVSLTVGTAKLEQRAKTLLLERVDAALQAAPVETQPKIAEQTQTLLDTLQKEIIQSVNSVIDEEERNIQKIMADSKKGVSQKAQILAALDTTANRVLALRQRLNDSQARLKG